MSKFSRVFLYLLVVLVGVSLWYMFRSSPYQRALGAREVATWGMGQELAKRYPGERALIISNPFAEESGMRKGIRAVEEAGIEGLRKGFEGKISVEAVVYPPIRPEAEKDPRSVYMPSTTTPLSFLVAEDSFDRLSQAHPECGLIVSLIGLPANLSKVALWNRAGPPRLALLFPDLSWVGGRQALRKAVQSGKLAVVVLKKPGSPPETVPVTEDYRAEFERRFVLVTPDNIDEALEKYPSAFRLAEGG